MHHASGMFHKLIRIRVQGYHEVEPPAVRLPINIWLFHFLLDNRPSSGSPLTLVNQFVINAFSITTQSSLD